jgi:hypothetical protein
LILAQPHFAQVRLVALAAISALTTLAAIHALTAFAAISAFAAITSIAAIAAATLPLGVLLAAAIGARGTTADGLHAWLLLRAFALTLLPRTLFGLAWLSLAWFCLTLLALA